MYKRLALASLLVLCVSFTAMAGDTHTPGVTAATSSSDPTAIEFLVNAWDAFVSTVF